MFFISSENELQRRVCCGVITTINRQMMDESQKLANNCDNPTPDIARPVFTIRLETKCNLVCNVMSLTFPEARFRADTELDSPSSSSFSWRVALEQPLQAPPSARRQSCRNAAVMFARFQKRQRTLSRAAIVFYCSIQPLCASLLNSSVGQTCQVAEKLERAELRQPIVATCQRNSVRVRNFP